MHLSDILRELRISSGLTQSKSAELLRVSERTWRRWESWNEYEGDESGVKLNTIELFCLKINQDFNAVCEKIDNIKLREKYIDKIKVSDVIFENIFSLSEIITNDILAAPREKRFNAQFCKLEHHDGIISITRWGDISIYSRTKCDENVTTWYNNLLTKKQIKDQVIKFLHRCYKRKLELIYNCKYNINEENKV